MGSAEYVSKTDLEEVVRLADELSDLAAAVVQAPHPPAPDDKGTEPVVRIPLDRGAVEIHEVLEDDLPVVYEHLTRRCYVVQSYSDGQLGIQVLASSTRDTLLVARALTAWLAGPGAMA